MKNIIILEKKPRQTEFTVCYWCAVPEARQPFYTDANFESAYADATPDELTALRSGEVVEFVERFCAESPDLPVGDIKARLKAQLIALQARVTNDNYWSFYGTYYDGDLDAWTNGGVA